MTLSPRPALLMASHLYNADTLAAWMTSVLTVLFFSFNQGILVFGDFDLVSPLEILHVSPFFTSIRACLAGSVGAGFF